MSGINARRREEELKKRVRDLEVALKRLLMAEEYDHKEMVNAKNQAYIDLHIDEVLNLDLVDVKRIKEAKLKVAQEKRIQVERDMKKYEQLQEQINAAEERLKKVKEDIKKLEKN